jgi:hypothetical protein
MEGHRTRRRLLSDGTILCGARTRTAVHGSAAASRHDLHQRERGSFHTTALRCPGSRSMVCWGRNDAGQCTVPPCPRA